MHLAACSDDDGLRLKHFYALGLGQYIAAFGYQTGVIFFQVGQILAA